MTSSINTDSIKSLRIILFIVLIILIIWIVYKIIRKKLKNKVDTISFYSGGLGSGKTLICNEEIHKLYFKNLKWYKRKMLFEKIKDFLHIPYVPYDDIEPVLATSIPIIIKKGSKLFHREDVYSVQLTKEHLLLQERLPKKSVIFIDEIGEFASNMGFTEENITKVFNEFVRLFRHYSKGGYIVCNDQCSQNVNYVVKRRMNVVNNLASCYVFWKFAFYYQRKMCISEEIKTIDMRVADNESYSQDNMDFKIRWLKWKGCYDTYCYSDRYNSVPYKKLNVFQCLKCFYLLRCPTDKEKKYQAKTSDIYVDLKKGGK